MVVAPPSPCASHRPLMAAVGGSKHGEAARCSHHGPGLEAGSAGNHFSFWPRKRRQSEASRRRTVHRRRVEGGAEWRGEGRRYVWLVLREAVPRDGRGPELLSVARFLSWRCAPVVLELKPKSCCRSLLHNGSTAVKQAQTVDSANISCMHHASCCRSGMHVGERLRWHTTEANHEDK